jgi:hypothetical protein
MLGQGVLGEGVLGQGVLGQGVLGGGLLGAGSIGGGMLGGGASDGSMLGEGSTGAGMLGDGASDGSMLGESATSRNSNLIQPKIPSLFSQKFHLYQLEISSLSAGQTSLSSHLFASQLVTPGRGESRSCLSRMKFTC